MAGFQVFLTGRFWVFADTLPLVHAPHRIDLSSGVYETGGVPHPTLLEQGISPRYTRGAEQMWFIERLRLAWRCQEAVVGALAGGDWRAYVRRTYPCGSRGARSLMRLAFSRPLRSWRPTPKRATNCKQGHRILQREHPMLPWACDATG